MKAVNSQIEAYLKEPDKLKYHQKELIEIIKNKIDPSSQGEGLDIGCATGALFRNLSPILVNYNLTGFDIAKDLIEHANRLNQNKSTKFFVGDFNSIDVDKKFDLICAVGVLSIFQEFEAPLKKWLSWLTRNGLLIIVGRFNSKDVDTQILFRNNAKGQTQWEGGMTSYSKHTVSRFLKKLGYKCEFKKFILPIDIKEDPNNPIRTFTRELKNGEKLTMDGMNIVGETFFAIIERDHSLES